MAQNSHELSSFHPFFGVRRELSCGPLERIELAARDGTALCLHHVRKGGTRGPVILAPGTAMTALSFCIDTVPTNIVEFLASKDFDVWLFDWRTSPLLSCHKRAYTIDDVARFDWPAAIQKVQDLTTVPKGENEELKRVSVVAHCVSSPCLLLSILRGHTLRNDVRAIVASAVALHLVVTAIHRFKIGLYLDKLVPSTNIVHQNPADFSGQIADLATTFLSWFIPTSYYYIPSRRHSWRLRDDTVYCDNLACFRHSVTFGEVVYHPRVNDTTHRMMGDLIPECLMAFLRDVAKWVRRGSVLTSEDMRNLHRLRLPIYFIDGKHNRMFAPAATEQTFDLLSKANDKRYYKRKVYEQFGHVDCYIGDDAAEIIWPDIELALERTRPVDDLKRIRGIGDMIEKKLNSLGVSSYEQVAEWSAADIRRVSQILDSKDRIEHEDWIAQARILAAGGQTEFSERFDHGGV